MEIDGKFVGNTPSSLVLTPGDHTVVVRKNGYMEWERTVHVTGGSVNLIADWRSSRLKAKGSVRGAPFLAICLSSGAKALRTVLSVPASAPQYLST